jgi:hypothetical protein
MSKINDSDAYMVKALKTSPAVRFIGCVKRLGITVRGFLPES